MRRAETVQGEHVYNVSCILTSALEPDSRGLTGPQPPALPRLGVSASTDTMKPSDAMSFPPGSVPPATCCPSASGLLPAPRSPWETCLDSQALHLGNLHYRKKKKRRKATLFKTAYYW